MKLGVVAVVMLCSGCELYFGQDAPTDPSAGADPGSGLGSSAPGDPTQPAPGNPGGPVQPGDPPPGPGPPPPPPPRCDHRVDVIGVYEARADHGGGYHPVGDSWVSIEGAGEHTVVLSAYEPTRWHLAPAPGVHVRAVYLYGYHAQTISLPGVPVVTETYANGGVPVYGYEVPGSGDALIARATAAAGPVTSFHGCYRATRWAVQADGSARSDCAVADGYHQSDLVRPCAPPPPR